MRDRTTRGRIDMQPYEHRRIDTRSLVAAYGLVLLIPVVLWAISNPALAVGIATLIGAAYVLGRVGMGNIRRHLRARTGPSTGAQATEKQSVPPKQ